MTSEESVIAVIRLANQLGIQYMVTGSLASNAYGVERSTKDADLVVQTANEQFAALRQALPPPLYMDPQSTFETITGTTRYIIVQADGPFKIELFLLSDDAHDQERFRRRKQGRLFSEPIWLPTAEDVIVTKLRWSKLGKRTKDVEDVRNVLAVQGDALDFAYIHGWCDQHGTRELLEQIRRSLPTRAG